MTAPHKKKAITCCRCHETARVDMALPIRKRRKQARDVGWFCDDAGPDYCPVCYPKAMKEAYLRWFELIEERMAR